MDSVGYEEFLLSELKHKLEDAERRLAELKIRCERMSIAHAELNARCAELVEAVRWERECAHTYSWSIGHPDIYPDGDLEIYDSWAAARAAVDALVGEG